MGPDYPRYEVVASDITHVVITSYGQQQTPKSKNENSDFNVVVKNLSPKSALFEWLVKQPIIKLFDDILSLKGIYLLNALGVILLPIFLWHGVQELNKQSASNHADQNHHHALAHYTQSVQDILHRPDVSPQSQYAKYSLIRDKTVETLRELTHDPDRKAQVALFLHNLDVTKTQKIHELCNSSDTQAIIPTQNCTDQLLNFYLGGDLKEAQFVGTSLRGTTFRNADLRSANFYHTNLENVDFENADLRKANFTATNVTCEQLQQAKFADGVILDDALYTTCLLPGAVAVSAL